MIYEYEAAILQFVNSVIPDIQLMTYAKQQDMFNAMSQVTRFPAFFYNRTPSNWNFNKVYKVTDFTKKKLFVPMEQIYMGRILYENQEPCFEAANELRFAWHKSPYIDLRWNPDETDGPNDTTLRVALRLLYIKVDEERAPDDKKGAQRFVEFSWKSQLFQEKGSSQILTEQINIHLVSNKVPTQAEIYNGTYLIKTVSLT